jgi:hypothetical protein
MPGRHRFGQHKGRKVQLRIDAADLARWTAHVERTGGYLSVLIRRAVDEYVDAHAKDKKPPTLYEWPAPVRRSGY